MSVLSGAHRNAERLPGSLRHRDVGASAKLQQAEVVAAHLIDVHVAPGGGDAHQIGVIAGEQVDQRHRVVDAGVDAGEHRQGHGVPAAAASSSRNQSGQGRFSKLAASTQTCVSAASAISSVPRSMR